MTTAEGKIRNQETPDDAHPGRRDLPVHDDPVRGGAGVERARAWKRRWRPTRRSSSRPSTTPSIDEPKANEIYQVGTIVNIVQSLKLPDGNIKVLVEGIERGKDPAGHRYRRLHAGLGAGGALCDRDQSAD